MSRRTEASARDGHPRNLWFAAVGAVRSFRAGTGRFVATYWWIIRGHLPSHKAEMSVIATLAALGALAQGGTITFIALAVNYLESAPGTSGRLWSFLGRLDSLAGGRLGGLLYNKLAMLGVFGACLLAMVLLGAWASYAATVRIRALGRSFHLSCAKRSLRIFARSTALNHPGMPATEGEFRRLLVRDTIFLGNSLEMVVRSLEPVLRMLVAAVLLFWIDWKLSLIIGPLFLLFLPAVYRLGRGVQRDSQQFYEPTLVGMLGGVMKLVTLFDRQEVRRDDASSRRLDGLYEADPQVRDYFDQYDKIQLASQRVQFTVASLSSLMIVGALLAGGYLAQMQALSWGLVLAYIMAVRQVLGSVQTVMSHVTSLTLYFPSAMRFIPFCETAPEVVDRPQAAVALQSEPIPIESTCRLAGGKPSATLEPGRPIFYLCDWPVGRINILQILQPLVAASAGGSDLWHTQTSFIGPGAAPLPGSIRGSLIGPDASGRREARVLGWLERLGVRDELEAIDGGLDAEMTEDVVQRLSAPLKMALVVLPALSDERPILLLDMWIVHWAGVEPAQALLELLKNKTILLCATGLALPITLAQSVIVAQEGRVTGIGSLSWFEGVKSELQSIGKAPAAGVSLEGAELGG